MKRILLVDEDTDLTSRFSNYLSSHGYTVQTAINAQGVDRVLHEQPVQVVVMEVALPGEDGLSICRRLASRNGPSVIFLSDMHEEADRIVGLELGADDYLPKPLSPRELLARVRAVLRRRDPAPAAPPTVEVLQLGGFVLDSGRLLLRGPGGRAAHLTRGENCLMAAFFSQPGRVLTRDALSEQMGGLDERSSDRVIDTQISRLRRKLNAHFNVELIRTVRGRGYICDIG